MRPLPCSLWLAFCLTVAGCAKSRPDRQDPPGGPPRPQSLTDAPLEPAAKANGGDNGKPLWSSPPAGAITYPRLGKVTRTKVRTRSGRALKTVTAREQLDKVVAFVDGQRTGWERPWSGIPVPQVTAEFYDGATFKGHFGVGPGFFETHREGDFASKSATAAECAAFLRLLGVNKKAIED